MLSNFDLIHLAKQHHLTNFNGVFSKDELPSQLVHGSFIVNMSNDRDAKGNLNQGSHWIAMFVDNSFNPFYFDSFGFPPPIEISNYLRKSRKQITYSTREIQDIKTDVCGYYCLAFCLYMTRNSQKYKSKDVFDDFLNKFDPNIHNNEAILKQMVRII